MIGRKILLAQSVSKVIRNRSKEATCLDVGKVVRGGRVLQEGVWDSSRGR